MRKADQRRTTKETDVTISLSIDGKGNSKVASGNGFFDHMMILWAKHGLFDLDLSCKGDVEIDFHHSAEDIGITLGQAFAQAIGDCRGIYRYAHAYVPMDEALVRVCLDIAGRSNLVYNVELTDRRIGEFESDLVYDFLKAFVDAAKITMHVDLIRGRNSHHCIEGVFKAFGRALCEACEVNQRAADAIPSTKGVL